MDHKNQKRILELSEEYGKENLVVILGNSESENAGITAETVTAGDPTDLGPLAGVSLGLAVYHIFELKADIEESVYDEQCSIMEMVLDVDSINEEVKSIREKHSKY